MTIEQLEETQEVDESVQLPDLLLSDMCDVCFVASAYVRVRVPDLGDLLYCGHHFAEREPKIAAAEYEIRDERARAALSSKDIRWEWHETKNRRRYN